MAGSMIVSLRLTKKTHEEIHVPKFNPQNGLKVLGIPSKRTYDPQKLNDDDQRGLKVESN
jgi:hypothetical protein